VLAYSVGQQLALAAFNVAAAVLALFFMAGTTDFRSIIRRGAEEQRAAEEGAEAGPAGG
jgi:hypothetical protein